MRLTLPLVLISALLVACSPSVGPATGTTTPPAPAPASIDWRQGDVDDAFTEAAASGKPVLLYWGAAWCPPCNQLKAGLFKDPDFIALTRRYVAVYLDGDEEGAQAWGERFGVRGYPTLIVLDPARRELTRIAGGNDAAELTRALTVAAGRRSAVADTLKAALAEPAAVSAEDWQVLADYGWEVDANRLLDSAAVPQTLQRLAAAAPLPAQQHRFVLLAAAAASDAGSVDAARLGKTLQAVLAAPAEVRINRELLGYQGAALVARAASTSAQRQALAAQLLEALEQADKARGDRADDALSRSITELALQRQAQPTGPLPQALVAQVKARVAALDAATVDAHARQASISTAAYALRQAGDDPAAEALLLAELPRSATPYYYMPELAELAEARGDTTAAIDWLRQAYEGAQGPATRVQWGVIYVEGLLRLAPDDAAGIERATASVIAELDGQPASYHQRTRQRFERLGGALQAWARQHDGAPVLARLHGTLLQHCAPAQAIDTAAQTPAACSGWLPG